MPDTITNPAASRPRFQVALWATGLFGLALMMVYHQTAWSIIAIWLRSDTFAHGFLILPISIWLASMQREELRQINPRSALWVTVLLVPAGFAWLLAWLVDVLVLQQLALVAMLVTGTWAILGHQLARALAFPLIFLFFAVPMGEALVPPMMEFTATSTVWLIQKSGIPVYREGLFFTLPSGSWSIVEACSGVRYIVASITLGVVYAYLTYRSFWRRALFVMASVVVPVFANSLRAYIIVMLGHFSDMTIATGVDHLFYGWVFFGIVIFLMFWLGTFFREDREATPGGSPGSSINVQLPAPTPSRLLATALVALLTAAAWPLWAYTSEARSGANLKVGITLPGANGDWQTLPKPRWEWQPDRAAVGQMAAYYRLDDQTLGLFIQYADHSIPDGEVVGSSAHFVATNSDTRVVSHNKVSVQLGGRTVLVDQARLRGVDGEILAWSWYRIGQLHTSNDYVAKFGEARASLGFGSPGSYRIVVALPLRDSVAATQFALQDFLHKHGGQLDKALDRAMDVVQ